MKIKQKTILIVLISMLLLVSFVSANVTPETDDLTIEVDYDVLRDNDGEIDFSTQITLTNVGNDTENLTLVYEKVSGYDITLQQNSLSLAATSSSDITLSGKLPVNTDQGEEIIGTLKITDSQGETSHSIKIDVKTMLELKKIRVLVNDHEKKSIDEDGEKIKDLNPGDKIELRFQLENRFDEDYDDGEIEGEVSIKLDDNDFDEDIDEEEDFLLDADQRISDEEDEIVLNFEVPITAEDKEYELEVKITSEDDNNAKYITKLDLKLEVVRNDNDVRIAELILAPSEISCYRKAKLEAKVINFGKDKQKHASLLFFNEKLGIDVRENFKLEEGISNDNDFSKEILIELGENVAAGTYPISASAFYDYNTLSYRENINLIVKDCETDTQKDSNSEEGQKQTSESQENNVTNEKGQTSKGSTESTNNQLTSSQIVKTVEDPYTSFDFIIAILIIAIVLVLVIIVLFILLLLR